MQSPGQSPGLLDNRYPFKNLLGFRMTAFETGRACFEMELGEKHNNPGGVPHGGVYAALLDSALGSAGCFIATGVAMHPAVTLNLNVSFLALARGPLLIAEGRMTGGGTRVFFAEGEVRDESGQCVATGTGTFRYLGTKQAD